MKTPQSTVHVVTEAQNGVALQERELPEPSEHNVLIETHYSFISAGTELNVVRTAREHPDRAGHKLGYSLAGVVLETGSQVTHVKPGDRVAAVGAGAHHASTVRVGKNLVIPVPNGVSLREAAPSAMYCFAFEGVRKLEPQFGENLAVLGAGMMGQLATRLLDASGVQPLVMEGNAYRSGFLPERARIFAPDDAGWEELGKAVLPTGLEGAIFCFGGDGSQAFEKLKEVMSKSPDGLVQGRMVFVGGIELTARLASSAGNLRLLSSAKAGPGYRDPVYEAGGGYPPAYVKWTVTRNVAVLLQAIAQKRLSVKELITHEFPYAEAQAAYELLSSPNPETLAVLLKHPSA